MTMSQQQQEYSPTMPMMASFRHDDPKEDSATRVCGAKLFTKIFPNKSNTPFSTLSSTAEGTITDSRHEEDYDDHDDRRTKDTFGSSIGTSSFGSDAFVQQQYQQHQIHTTANASVENKTGVVNSSGNIVDDILEKHVALEDILQFDPNILKELQKKHVGPTVNKNRRRGLGLLPALPQMSATIEAERSSDLVSLSEHVRGTKVFDDAFKEVDQNTCLKTIQSEDDDDNDIFPPFQLEDWLKSVENAEGNEELLAKLKEERERFQSEKMLLQKEMEEFRKELLKIQSSLMTGGKVGSEGNDESKSPADVFSDPVDDTQPPEVEEMDKKTIGPRFKKDWSLRFSDLAQEDSLSTIEKAAENHVVLAEAESCEPTDANSSKEFSEEGPPEDKKVVHADKTTTEDRSSKHDRNPKTCSLLQLAEQQGALLATLHFQTKLMESRDERRVSQIDSRSRSTKALIQSFEKKAAQFKSEAVSPSKSLHGRMATETTAYSSAKKIDEMKEPEQPNSAASQSRDDEYARDMEQVQKLLQKYGGKILSSTTHPTNYQDMEPHFGKDPDDEAQPVIEIANLDALSEHTSVYSYVDDPDSGFHLHADLCQKDEWMSNGSTHSRKKSSLRPLKYKASSTNSLGSKSPGKQLPMPSTAPGDRVRFKKSIQSRVIVGGVHYDNEIRIVRPPNPDPRNVSDDQRDDASASTPHDDQEAPRVPPPAAEKRKIGNLIQYWEVHSK
jgi:hypothetical protein